MSAFSYVRPGGLWSAGVPVLHAELTQLDQDHFKSLNAIDGGTWAPSSPIVIGGSGLAMTGNFSVASSGTFDVFSTKATFSNAVWIGTGASPGDFQVFSESAFNGAAGFNAGITTTTLDALGAVTLGNTLAVAGNGTFSSGISVALGATFGSSGSFVGPITATGGISATGASAFQALTTNGALTANGLVNIAGGAAVTTPLTCTAAGRVVDRVTTSSSVNITTIGPHNFDTLIITSLSGAGSVIIDDTGAQNGDKLRVVNLSSNLAIVQDPVGPTTILSLSNAAGQRNGALFMRVGGTWQWISRDPIN